jgi:ferric-dicitrate binding protein FerR (iron transport regulator)
VAVVHGADIAALTAWVQGRLVFEDTPFRDVVRDLERAFALKVTVADAALLDRRVTGQFGDESADFVLATVTAALGAHYERAGNAVTVRKGVLRTHDRPPVTSAPLTTAQGRDSHQP